MIKEFRVGRETNPGRLANAILLAFQQDEHVTLVGIGVEVVYHMTRAVIYANHTLTDMKSNYRIWTQPDFAEADQLGTTCVVMDIRFVQEPPSAAKEENKVG